ncbi:MAG: hypothetical protein DRH57_05755 [Candidatus Cloacimonadota bacterium]|nr:MAG: hypothetical protein DRH57_05755 [Candidatus Cloacimonadota bacterium]
MIFKNTNTSKFSSISFFIISFIYIIIFVFIIFKYYQMANKLKEMKSVNTSLIEYIKKEKLYIPQLDIEESNLLDNPELPEQIIGEGTELFPEKVEQYLEQEKKKQNFYPDLCPVKNPYITKDFLPEKNHFGLDFAGSEGDSIFASASGIVTKVFISKYFGNALFINHLNIYQTFYAHNKAILVEPYDFVKKGDVIALLGSTGYSSAPHLHFEIIKDAKRINPKKILKLE